MPFDREYFDAGSTFSLSASIAYILTSDGNYYVYVEIMVYGPRSAATRRSQWAIPLFNYTPLQMTINGVQGGIGNMSRGVVI